MAYILRAERNHAKSFGEFVMFGVKIEINEMSSIVTAAKETRKRNKGKLMHLFPKDYVVVDIETTSLSPDWGDIIEIGAVKVVNNEIVDKFNYLVNPTFPSNYELDDFTTNLTGISENDINNFGKSNAEVLREFLDFVNDSILVAHNASFDINFLYDAILKEFDYEFKNDYVDTYNLGHFYAFKKPEMNNHKVADFVKKFNLSNEAPFNDMHRALNDSLLEKQIFDLEREKLGDDWILESQYTRHSGKKYELKKYEANLDADESNPFYGLNIVFTGTLDRFTRNDAHEFIANLGATPQKGVRMDTDMLVVGVQQNNTKEPNKSSKQIKAESLIEQGKADISIVSDEEFLKMAAEIID